jgi:hypothetical protein
MALSASLDTRLKLQHETIAELVAGFSEEALKRHVVPDKWSAFEQVVHLAAYQPTFIERLALMQTGQRPLFQRYVAENDPHFYKYQEKSVPALLKITAGDRSFIYDSISGMHANQLLQKGVHPRYGEMTIAQWAEFFVLHEAHHLWNIAQLVSILRSTPHE